MRARRTTRGRRPRRGACARRPEECRPKHERQQENIIPGIHPAVGREQVSMTKSSPALDDEMGTLKPIESASAVLALGAALGARGNGGQPLGPETTSRAEQSASVVSYKNHRTPRRDPSTSASRRALARAPSAANARARHPRRRRAAGSARRVHSHKKRSSRRTGAPPAPRPRSRRRRRGGPPSARRAGPLRARRGVMRGNTVCVAGRTPAPKSRIGLLSPISPGYSPTWYPLLKFPSLPYPPSPQHFTAARHSAGSRPAAVRRDAQSLVGRRCAHMCLINWSACPPPLRLCA